MAKQTINIADKETLDEIKDKVNLINNNTSNVSFIDDGVIQDSDFVKVGEYVFENDISSPKNNLLLYKNEVHYIGAGGHYKLNGTEWVEESILPCGYTLGVAVVYHDEIHYIGQNTHIKYDGSKWTNVSTSVPPYINAKYDDVNYAQVAVFNDEIYVCLGNSSSSGTHSNSIDFYKWNGSTWTQITDAPRHTPSGSYSGVTTPKGFVVFNGYLHIFTNGYDSSASADKNYWYRYNGNTFTLVSNSLPMSPRYCLIKDGKIYAYGASGIYSWNGVSWTSEAVFDTLSINVGDSILYVNDKFIIISNYSSVNYVENGRIYKYSGSPKNITFYHKYSNGPFVCAHKNEIYVMGSSSSSSSECYKWDGKKWIMLPSLPEVFTYSYARAFSDGENLYYYSKKNIYVLNDTETSWKLIYTADSEIAVDTMISYKNEVYFADSSVPRMLHKLEYDKSTYEVNVYDIIHIPYVDTITMRVIGEYLYTTKGYRYDGVKWDKDDRYTVLDSSYEYVEKNGFLHHTQTDNQGGSSTLSENKKHIVYDKYFNSYSLDDIPFKTYDGFSVVCDDSLYFIYKDLYKLQSEVMYIKKITLEKGTIIKFETDKIHLIKPILNCEKLEDGNLKVLETGLVKFGVLYDNNIGSIGIENI